MLPGFDDRAARPFSGMYGTNRGDGACKPVVACARIFPVPFSLPPGATMSKTVTQIRTKTQIRTERPRLHKVILFNDDYTPRDFVVQVLKAGVPAERDGRRST